MGNFIAQPGVATAMVDFTSDLSLLGVGLVGLMTLAAGAIALAAIRHHISQRTTPKAETACTSAARREAA